MAKYRMYWKKKLISWTWVDLNEQCLLDPQTEKNWWPFDLVMDDWKPSDYSKWCGLTRGRKLSSPPIDFLSIISFSGHLFHICINNVTKCWMSGEGFGQDPSVSKFDWSHVDILWFFLYWFDKYSLHSSRKIGNIPGVSGCCGEFVRLCRALEPPPKVLYSVVHVAFRALELPRQVCGRLQSLKFWICWNSFPKIVEGQRKGKS